ncbi:MAG: hypothetical protein OHK0015_53340 [Chloroflexi bacterium OHK40]
MSETPSTDDSALLALCAVLRWFDRDMLVALRPFDDDQLVALLASDRVLPVPGRSGVLQLRAEVRSDALARLRASQPGDELRLHERAFRHFAAWLASTPLSAQRLLIEDECFFHLEALRAPLAERREWQRLAALAALARAAQPDRPDHLHLLIHYEGLIAIQNRHYSAGERLLGALLARADVAPELRMRATNVLAHSKWYQSRYEQARELYWEVYLLAESCANRAFQGHALRNMSIIDHELGYFERALQLSKESLHCFQQGGYTYEEAHARYSIAKTNTQLGRWQEAREYFAQSEALYKRLGVQAQLANVYCLQGLLAFATGDLEASEALYTRGIAIGRSPEHGDISLTTDGLLLLGLLYQIQGRSGQALASFVEAATLARQTGNAHAHALAHYRRGAVLAASGDTVAALEAYGAAVELVESLRGGAASEEVKLGLVGTTQQIYEATVLLLFDQGRHAEAFHFAERARSRAFLDMQARRAPAPFDAPEQPVVTPTELQARLPADALLLAYVTTGVLPQGEHMLARIAAENPHLLTHLAAPARTLLFAVTSDRLMAVDLKLNPNQLRPDPAERAPGQRWLAERRLRALYDRLVAPVAGLLDGRATLFIAPHGPLHHVPFAALRAPDGRHLLDRAGPVIALAPSGTVLVRSCLDRYGSAEGAFLALGYNGQGVPLPRQQAHLMLRQTDRDDRTTALDHAESEAHAIAALMGGTAWAGPEPKSAALARAAPGLRGLHIAGHAVFTADDPLGSYLAVGAEDHLTARDVMGLRLGADLVTLSACASGLSQVLPGDELLGLLRAWLLAGAATVVCTLWEASDVVARLLMERFYAALSAGSPAGAAFREAVVEVRELTGREVAAIFARWRAETHVSPDWVARAVVPLDEYDTRPYADPRLWAPFTLIGRP